MDELEQIRQKIDIVSLINEYVPLKKAGRNFKALCPFHSEKTPSFIVSPERQIWHCFGSCQTGGDIFTFLMKYENLEFPEALKILAKRAGVTLRDYRPTETSRLKEKLYEINHLASEFYHYLLTSHRVGKRALDYALSRGISQKSIETFSLGYAPNLWDGLIKFLVGKKGYKIEDLNRAGLVIKSEDSGYFDRFRGRLMFSLRDYRGNVVGFAGRLLPEEEEKRKEGKYINSPETPVYKKGDVLYGLEITREAIKKERKAVIVEGEIDAILSFQVGVSNVVAIKGSALTEGQVNLIKRYTENLILALDTDLAGDSAARRGIEIAENAGLNIKVVELSFGKDPADCAFKSPLLWKKSVKNAIPVFDYLLSSAVKRFDKNTAEGKTKIVQEFLASLARIDNEIIKGHYLKKLALEIDVSLEAVAVELAKIIKKQKHQLAEGDQKEVLRLRQTREREEVLEEYLLSIILQAKRQKEFLEILLKVISLEDIKTLAIKRILKTLKEYLEKEKIFKIKTFITNLTPELVSLVDRLYLADLGEILKNEAVGEKEVKKTALEIKKLSLKRKIKEVTEKIKNAGENQELITKYNQEFKKYTHELNLLSAP